jgi:hypothetical protein
VVCGVNDQRVQRRLLAEADLTFQKAYDIAITMEAAERNARELQGDSSSSRRRTQGVHAEERGRGSQGHKVLPVPMKPQPR